MGATERFRCPDCGFRVFNRRFNCCEHCGRLLPADMAYTPSDLTLLEAEQQRIEQARLTLVRQAEQAAREQQRRRGEGG